jgi:manganese oxidase
MRSTAVSLLFAATVLVSGTPINNTSSTGNYTCSGHMDSQLPYYQPRGFNFSGNIRRYYVAAEIDTWNYAPSGMYTTLILPDLNIKSLKLTGESLQDGIIGLECL